MSVIWLRACSQVVCLTHSGALAGGHPESTTVPVGRQAGGLVKYHRCWIELAPLGLSDDFERGVVDTNVQSCSHLSSSSLTLVFDTDKIILCRAL